VISDNPLPLTRDTILEHETLALCGIHCSNLLTGNGRDEVDVVAAIGTIEPESVLCFVKLRNFQRSMKLGFGNSVFLIMSPQDLGTFVASRLTDGVFHRSSAERGHEFFPLLAVGTANMPVPQKFLVSPLLRFLHGGQEKTDNRHGVMIRFSKINANPPAIRGLAESSLCSCVVQAFETKHEGCTPQWTRENVPT
jgi:hypothetical protein